MNNSSAAIALIAQISLGAVVAFAAEANPGGAADRAWSGLKTFGRPETRFFSKGNGSSAATPAAKSLEFITQADRLNEFYTKYPDHYAAKEAKWRELSALNHAALNGDASREPRRLRLLEDVRKEAALPESRRFEVVAYSNQVAIARRKLGARSSYLEAQESATRALIAEFPAVALGYSSLLAIARDSDPARGPAIARELLGMPGSPSGIKSEAQLVLKRFDLIGQSINAISMRVGAPISSAASENQVIVIYAWSMTAPQPLRTLRQWAEHAKSVHFIGICIDQDVEAAAKFAANTAPAGEQRYDPRGINGNWPQALHINRDPVIYLVDRSGVIRDVQGRDNFSAKVKALLQ